jgi:L-ornithine Nalpha-acyltransferase
MEMIRLPVVNAESFVRRGELSLRLARGESEIRACQRLRYLVFYEELSAHADAFASVARIDADRFDAICDHLVVVRHGESPSAETVRLADGELVGTYRLLRQDVAERHGGFYTADEFDIAPLLARHPQLRFLELGRSCVLAAYRTMPVIELLWQGIWDYVRSHRIDVMFGCASFEGADPDMHAAGLGFLAAARPVPPEWHVRAKPHRYVEMSRWHGPDTRHALRTLPPLVKGYLRLGCYIGEGAVIDHQFNTVDILIVLPVEAINTRYFGHFGAPLEHPPRSR